MRPKHVSFSARLREATGRSSRCIAGRPNFGHAVTRAGVGNSRVTVYGLQVRQHRQAWHPQRMRLPLDFMDLYRANKARGTQDIRFLPDIGESGLSRCGNLGGAGKGGAQGAEQNRETEPIRLQQCPRPVQFRAWKLHPCDEAAGAYVNPHTGSRSLMAAKRPQVRFDVQHSGGDLLPLGAKAVAALAAMLRRKLL